MADELCQASVSIDGGSYDPDGDYIIKMMIWSYFDVILKRRKWKLIEWDKKGFDELLKRNYTIIRRFYINLIGV